MSKDPSILLEHILESIELIEHHKGDYGKEAFISSVLLQDAIIRRIEIIGEAVKNLPEDLKTDYPQVSWKSIAGMRDVIVHEYFGIDLDLTWEVVQTDIPSLKIEILKIKEDLDKKS